MTAVKRLRKMNEVTMTYRPKNAQAYGVFFARLCPSIMSRTSHDHLSSVATYTGGEGREGGGGGGGRTPRKK